MLLLVEQLKFGLHMGQSRLGVTMNAENRPITKNYKSQINYYIAQE